MFVNGLHAQVNISLHLNSMMKNLTEETTTSKEQITEKVSNITQEAENLTANDVIVAVISASF